MSPTVWVWLKRATRRAPSARRSCREVVGALSLTPPHSPLPPTSLAAAAAEEEAPAAGASAVSLRPAPVKAFALRV